MNQQFAPVSFILQFSTLADIKQVPLTRKVPKVYIHAQNIFSISRPCNQNDVRLLRIYAP